MKTVALLFAVTLGCMMACLASADTIGDLSSSNNNLSWMISVSRPWDGTNADLNGQRTDILPANVRATVTFKRGTFAGGTYRGWLHQGDFVFYEVDEVVPCHGEWRRIVRAGRCGNPATGRYFIPKPKEPEPPPPCVEEPPPCEEIRLPVVIKETERIACPAPKVTCQSAPVTVNVTTNVTTVIEAAPRQAPVMAQRVGTVVVTQRSSGTLGGGAHWYHRYRTPQYCPPYPDPPIPDPPVRPAPPY